MPGAKGFGPGGRWIHDRAHDIMKNTKDHYGTERGKAIAYALATQQAHKVGKSPQDFRTPTGVQEAKAKLGKPKSAYQKTAAVLRLANFMRHVKLL